MSSSGSDMEFDDEDQLQDQLKQINIMLKSNPYHYQSYIDKIKVLKKLGELIELRETREKFAELYPLAENIWLEWIRDEQDIAATEEEKLKIFELFERSIKDYLSVKLWLEFCQFSCGFINEEGIKRSREIFERAIIAAGVHIANGSLIWEAYRIFENTLYEINPTAPQKERVDNIFRRQLSVPHLNLEQTFEEYSIWSDCEPESNILSTYNNAKQLIKEREEFENALISLSGKEQLEAYFKYLEFEKKSQNPVRIQNLYERCVTDHCLEYSVWESYIFYIDFILKDMSSLNIHKRSIRNCPWFHKLWISYLRSSERHSQSMEETTTIFNKALEVEFEDFTSHRELWIAYIDFIRRSNFENDEEKKNNIQSYFEKALNHLSELGDNSSKLEKYYAWFEAKCMNNFEKARELWVKIIFNSGNTSDIWHEYINFEKNISDKKHLKKVYIKALERCKDFPQIIGDSWLQFEREEGTLEDFENAEGRIQKRLKIFEEIKSKQAEKEDDKKQKFSKDKNQQQNKLKKRKNEAETKPAPKKFKTKSSDEFNSNSKDNTVFKKPLLPTSNKTSGSASPAPSTTKTNETTSKEPRHDSDETKTVFVSNLSFSTNEDHLRECLSSSGEVVDVRLALKPNGKSRGFAYVEFKSVSSAQNALTRDHEQLLGRPMYISKCNSNKGSRDHHFKYQTGLEKKKLFVKNLPNDTTENDIRTIFSKFGSINDIRLVQHKSGHFKGICFIEFAEESAASSAIMKTDGMEVKGKNIFVALSNPPDKKNPMPIANKDPIKTTMKPRLGTRKPITQFIPRSLIKKS